MSNLKWVEIARESSKERYQVLSDYLNEKGMTNTVDFVECGVGDFDETITECKEKYDSIRFGAPYRESVVNYFSRISATMAVLRAADCLVRADGVWWLRSSDHLAIEKVLINVGARLDLESSALVVGAGAMARLAVSAISKLGYKNFNITNKFEDQGKELVADLRKIYFGSEFTYVSQDRLVLLPGTNGIVINTTPLKVSNDLLNELYYFNFLKNNGVAIDCTIIPPLTPFIQEAKTIGIHVIYGYEIAAYSDCFWAKWAFGVDLDHLGYREYLAERVAKVDFDLSPFTN